MKLKKTGVILAVVLCIVSVFPAVAANPGAAQGVTPEMCTVNYWKSRTLGDADKVLMTADDIAAVNKSAVDSKNTFVMGIDTMSATYNANNKRLNMHFDVPSRALYINGEKIDKEAYYEKINNAIIETGYTETERESGYGICVKCTDMKFMPTLDSIGYSADDTDDEMEYECITVNEPFLIRGECTIDSVRFYYGYSLDCEGWVPADDFALCESRQEWLDAWQFDLESDDFLVVTQDNLTLEPNMIDEYSSNLMLNLSTSLKLVPDDEIPQTIGGRSTWNNYVVYVPTKNSDGMYEAKPALISQHSSVSVGYLPFTQANVLDVAFSCLGDAYGWGGMNNRYDCSLYTRSVYRCFGIVFPRNTNWQQCVNGTKIDFTGMTDEEKQEIIETLPAGTVLFISGHTMMYLGTVDSVGYVISDLGTVLESEGSNDVLNIMSVTITPLTVRRGKSYGFTTWLHNLTCAVMVMPKTAMDLNEMSVDISRSEDDENVINLSVSYNGNELTEGLHYTLTRAEETITIEGINSFAGTMTVEVPEKEKEEPVIDEPTDPVEEDTESFMDSLCSFLKRAVDYIKGLFSAIIWAVADIF